MSVTLVYPLGLLGLLMLPAILWLHRYVLTGERRVVSNLALWRDPAAIGIEGQTKQRPPLTPTLLLELLAAIALTLLMCDLRLVPSAQTKTDVAVIVDGTASMSAGGALHEAQRRFDELAVDEALTFTLFSSGLQANRLGPAGMTKAEALDQLGRFQPHSPRRPLDKALGVAAAAGYAAEQLVIFTDDMDFEHPRALHVGAPAPNVGIVNASWPPGEAANLILRRFGNAPMKLQATLQLGDGAADPIAIDFAGRDIKHITLGSVRHVDRVVLTLPADALLADNRVELLKPPVHRLTVLVQHKNKTVAQAVRRAIAAIPALVEISGPADLVVVDERVDSRAGLENTFVFSIVTPPGRALLSIEPLVVQDKEPLMRGIDPRGLIWYGTPEQETKTAALRAGGTPLVWREPRGLTMQVDPRGSNVFGHGAFVLLLANLAQELSTQRGPYRRNWRVGDTLVLRAPNQCAKPNLEAPDGRRREMLRTNTQLSGGPLATAGVFTARCDERVLARVVTNLLDPAQGDLSTRKPAAMAPTLVGRQAVHVNASLLSGWLWLIAIAAAGLGWAFLARARR